MSREYFLDCQTDELLFDNTFNRWIVVVNRSSKNKILFSTPSISKDEAEAIFHQIKEESCYNLLESKNIKSYLFLSDNKAYFNISFSDNIHCEYCLELTPCILQVLNYISPKTAKAAH